MIPQFVIESPFGARSPLFPVLAAMTSSRIDHVKQLQVVHGQLALPLSSVSWFKILPFSDSAISKGRGYVGRRLEGQ